MARPGPRNLITDVPGLMVGNAGDLDAISGVTVILPGDRTVAAVDVRGGGPGTRETDALAPENLVGSIDAIVLAGGSVFGLDAAGGVTAHLAARGRGFGMPGTAFLSPIVPAAILFDLTNGGNKAWGTDPPYRRLGLEALNAAAADFELGNAGAGLGARAGSLKGGLGSVSTVTHDGLIVGALVAANPFGSTLIPGTRTFWAWPFAQNGELGDQQPPLLSGGIPLDWPDDTKNPTLGRTNTTIGLVATNAALTTAEAKRVAIMAQDGFARACRPMHTPVDGDVLFALATCDWILPEPRALAVARIGMIAADCAARALARGVYEARSIGEMVGYRDSA
jgi:L-aminopeptidase/D-esterase-like protein